ncbi:MAG TPA: hypothetical protein VIF09_03535 [Polyangiaceae bacterium]|jgi:hypothetical protein
MLVPTIAFAFWVASLPAAQPAMSLDGLLAETAHLDATGERVKLKLVTPELVTAAEAYLDLPMGAERFLTMHGKRYVFVLEQHYHPPGFVGAPNGFHKGVTVYELHSAPSALGSPRSAGRQ